ncbi:ABC transporter ATP-binding protein [Rubrivivax gelatinosus]|uniref:O-antigen export system ATP-binding protein RfbB n=1 Tax=Rubrivivax gelatinosus (strain NBRC 100245 / IL144) TaxID=983917 RepID=I0HL92_RUBGI|nr:ABC transporter ATP-binding protein [Rubrivivax gelatinosus]BAL93779.1 O-antigen export system ATP-binding protein RfbB [Rubrivivax gelatinosus IL144]
MSNTAVIEVHDLRKEFRIGGPGTLKGAVAGAWRRLRGDTEAGRKAPFAALDGVNFSVAEGEVLGIIGHNGAGKSTLLKMLAGISAPTSGRVNVRGRVAPLIEVGAGLVGELTGRENVYLNGTILGMSRREIDRKFDEIVAFAELERFIDTPLKRYSSGMQVRLGFAIATAVDSQIVIVDEVLAVGDIAFQRKCYDRMQDLIYRQGRTILFVSHNVKEIERLSKRVLLLDHGRVAALGSPQEVCDLYFEQSHRKILEQADGGGRGSSHVQASGEIELESIETLDGKGQPCDSLPYAQPCTFRITLKLNEPIDLLEVEFGVHTMESLWLATCTSHSGLKLQELAPGRHVLDCRFDSMPFLPGVYGIRLHLGVGAANHGVFYGEHLARFAVSSGDAQLASVVRQGFVELAPSWDLVS